MEPRHRSERMATESCRALQPGVSGSEGGQFEIGEGEAVRRCVIPANNLLWLDMRAGFRGIPA